MDLNTTDIDTLHRLIALEADAPAGVADMDIVNDLLSAMQRHEAFADQADPIPELLAATEESARRLTAAGLADSEMQSGGRVILHSTADGRRFVTEGT